MAATCTYTVAGRKVKVHTFSWKSHTDGTVSGVGASSGPISGTIKKVEFVPNANSGYTPTSGYATKLVDDKGFDWLFGVGSATCVASGAQANRYKVPLVSSNPPIINGETLTPSITGAGDTKYGEIKLVVEELPILEGASR